MYLAPDFLHFCCPSRPNPWLAPCPLSSSLSPALIRLLLRVEGLYCLQPLPPSALCQSPGGLGRGNSCQIGPLGWVYTCPQMGRVCPYGSVITVLSSFLSCNWQQCLINSSRCWMPMAQCCLRQRVKLDGEDQSPDSHALGPQCPFNSLSFSACPSSFPPSSSPLHLASIPWRQKGPSLKATWAT